MTRLKHFIATLSAALLAACGPNGGGTGTGDSVVQLSDFNARPASSCSAPFAASLDCDVVLTASVDAALLPGTAQLQFSASGPEQARLALFGNGADLQLACGRLQFRGEWGVGADGVAAYYGWWSLEPAPRRALLRVQALPGGALLLDVIDLASGQVLVGRLVVQREAASAPPPAC